MNWRRGAVLTVVNIAAVLGTILQLELAQKRWANEGQLRPIPVVQAAQDSADATQTMFIQVDPCTWVDITPREVEPVIFGNLPAELVSGWGGVCPSSWSIAAKLQATRIWLTRPLDRTLEWKLNAWMLLLVAVQWLLLGSLPTLPHGSWWREPGAFITTCIATGVLLVAIPNLTSLGRLAAACAFFGWPVWAARGVLAGLRHRRASKSKSPGPA